jgi:hypothetical protein
MYFSPHHPPQNTDLSMISSMGLALLQPPTPCSPPDIKYKEYIVVVGGEES